MVFYFGYICGITRWNTWCCSFLHFTSLLYPITTRCPSTTAAWWCSWCRDRVVLPFSSWVVANFHLHPANLSSAIFFFLLLLVVAFFFCLVDGCCCWWSWCSSGIMSCSKFSFPSCKSFSYLFRSAATSCCILLLPGWWLVVVVVVSSAGLLAAFLPFEEKLFQIDKKASISLIFNNIFGTSQPHKKFFLTS